MVGLDNPIHLLFLLMILLLIFGAKRLPEMGRSMGSGLRGFKDAISGETPGEATGELAPAASSTAFTQTSEPPAKVAAEPGATPAA